MNEEETESGKSLQGEQLTLAGIPDTEVRQKLAALRVKTGERLEVRFPELGDLVEELFRAGNHTTLSIARQIAPLVCKPDKDGKITEGQINGVRAHVDGMLNRRIPAREQKDILARATLMGVSDGAAKAREMINAADGRETKHLGNIAIALDKLNTITQLHSGGATSRAGKVGNDDEKGYEYYAAKARARIEKQRAEAIPVEVDVTPGVVEE